MRIVRTKLISVGEICLIHDASGLSIVEKYIEIDHSNYYYQTHYTTLHYTTQYILLGRIRVGLYQALHQTTPFAFILVGPAAVLPLRHLLSLDN